MLGAQSPASILQKKCFAPVNYFLHISGKIPGPLFLPLAGSAPFIMLYEPRNIIAVLSYIYEFWDPASRTATF